MTVEKIQAQCEALREAGRELRRRPALEVLQLLEDLLDLISDERSDRRRELALELPKATGFTAPVVRRGLELGFGDWRGRAFRELVSRELGATLESGSLCVSGFPTTAVLLAGSIPMPSLLSIVAPLALGSPVLVKPASRDRVTPRIVAESIADLDAELGRCVGIVDFPGSDDACSRAFASAECVVATGSDETVSRVGRLVAPPRRFVGYGHRLSIATLSDASTRGTAVDDVTARLALDIALWDQLGCLSPLAIFVPSADPRAPDRVAEALANALVKVEEDLPRGDVDSHSASAIHHERGQAEMRAAAGKRVAVLGSASTAWTVVREDTPEIRPAPLHRFVRVMPVTDLSKLIAALAPLGPHLAAVAVEGFGAEEPALCSALANLGASRLCRAGRMQSPPLGWRHDNRGVLTPIARFTDIHL